MNISEIKVLSQTTRKIAANKPKREHKGRNNKLIIKLLYYIIKNK